MKRVATALVLVPLVLAAVFWLPIWIFSIVLGLVALVTTHEYLNLCQASGLEPFRNTTLVFVALLFAAWPITLNSSVSINVYPQMSLAVPLSPMVGLAATVLLALLALCLGMRRPGENEALGGVLGGAAASVFAIPYIALTLGALVLLRDLHWGPWWLLYLFVVVWSGDIFAYYTGRAIGRHKLAPRISPGKTWEGAAASFVTSIGFGALMFAFKPE